MTITGYGKRIDDVASDLKASGDVAFSRNPFQEVCKRVYVAASARTGGNFFCERMRAHGVRIGEYFHSRRLREHLRASGERLEDYCRETIGKAAHRGTFGVKGSIDALAVLALAGEYPRHIRDWRFVSLTRVDVVAQAVSHRIAAKSGAWRSVKVGSPVATDDYDAGAIARLARGHLRVAAEWERFFEDVGVVPLRITYEQLAGDPDETCRRAAAFLGLRGPSLPAPAAPALARQSGPLNAAWHERFHAEQPELAADLLARARA